MRTISSRKIAVAVLATLLISSAVFAASVLADPASESRDTGHPVVVSFTKWVTISPGYPIMAGTVKADDVGTFAGEILLLHTTQSGDITQLQAVYEVQAGDQSFKALVQGGQNNQAGTALLDGVILGGWHTGAKVHVQYRVVPKCGQANALNDRCFTGTITISPDSEN
jgi:hypothetical protein